MSISRRLVPLSVCAALAAAGCGGGNGDDDNETIAPATGPNAAYINGIGDLCDEALSRRALLDQPSPGDNEELAQYLRDVLKIQSDFRNRAEKLKPPAALAADQKLAERLELELADTLAGYERAARGGNRRFLKIVRALQNEANPQIDKLNDVFERMEITRCETDKIKGLEARRG